MRGDCGWAGANGGHRVVLAPVTATYPTFSATRAERPFTSSVLFVSSCTRREYEAFASGQPGTIGYSTTTFAS